MDYSLIQSLAIVIMLGFAIGMQRTLTYMRSGEHTFGGSRTFAL
ncbi:MAG TPA: MgtC/SapB family protein, partial [Nitratifractor salsuginis]|nr:MgtC/SapB family protein [Nitratifractor salsuginis]